MERIGENWRELELQAVTYSGAELNENLEKNVNLEKNCNVFWKLAAGAGALTGDIIFIPYER